MKEKSGSGKTKTTPLKFFSRHVRGRSGGGGDRDDGSSSSVVSRRVKSNNKGGGGGITPKGIFSNSARPTTPKRSRGDDRARSSSCPASAKSRIRQTFEKLAQKQHTQMVPVLFDKRDEEDALAENNNDNDDNNNNVSPDNASRKSSSSTKRSVRKPSSQTTRAAACDDSRDEEESAIRDGGEIEEGVLHTSSADNEHDVEEKSATREGGGEEMVETQEEEDDEEEVEETNLVFDIGDVELIVYDVESTHDPVFFKGSADSKCPTEFYNPQSCSAASQVSGFEIATAELLKQQQQLHQLIEQKTAMQLLDFPEQETPIHTIMQPLQQKEETQRSHSPNAIVSSLHQQHEEKQHENSNGSVESQQQESTPSGLFSSEEEKLIHIVEVQYQQQETTNENYSPHEEVAQAVVAQLEKSQSTISSTNNNKPVSEVTLQDATCASDLVSREISTSAQDRGAIEKKRAWSKHELLVIVGLAENPGKGKKKKVNNGDPIKPRGSFKLSKIDPSLATSGICAPPQTKGKDLFSSVEVNRSPMVYIEGMVESLRPKMAVTESNPTKRSVCSSSTAVTAKIGNESAKLRQKNKSRSTHSNVKNSKCVPVSYIVALPTNLEALSLLTRSGNSGTEGFLKKKIPVVGFPFQPSEDPIVNLVGNMDTVEVVARNFAGSSQLMEESPKPEKTTNDEIVPSNYEVCSQSVGIADSFSGAATNIASVSDWFQKLLDVTKKNEEPASAPSNQLGQQTEKESMVKGFEAIIKTCYKICDEMCLPTPETTRELGDVIDSESATARSLPTGDHDNNESEPLPLAFRIRTENGKQSISLEIDWVVLESFFAWSKKASVPKPNAFSCDIEAELSNAKTSEKLLPETKFIMEQPGNDQEFSRGIVEGQTNSEIQYNTWTASPNIMDQPATARTSSSSFAIQQEAAEHSSLDREIQYEKQTSSLSSIMVQPMNKQTAGPPRVEDSSTQLVSVLLSARRKLEAEARHDKTMLNYPDNTCICACISLLEKYGGSLVINKTLSGDAATDSTDDATNAGGIVGRCESYSNNFCCDEEHWSTRGTFTFQETDFSWQSFAGLSMEENTTMVLLDPVEHFHPHRYMSFDNNLGAEVLKHDGRSVLNQSVEVELADDRDEANSAPSKSESKEKRKESKPPEETRPATILSQIIATASMREQRTIAEYASF